MEDSTPFMAEPTENILRPLFVGHGMLGPHRVRHGPSALSGRIEIEDFLTTNA